MEVIALVILLLIAVGVQSFVFSKFAFYKLDYRCGFSVPEAHEGDELTLVEVVQNKKLLPVPWLKVDIHSSVWLDFAGTKSVIAQEDRRVTSSFLLKSRQRITRKWKLKCLKRGVFKIENTTLISGDLIGSRVVSEAAKVDAELVVYPEVIDIDEILIPTNLLQGDMIVRRWIIDDPFIISGAREYTPRDSMNRIHWQATAREGKLMVKKNDFTSQMTLVVMLNIQSADNEYNEVIYKPMIELGIKVAATMLDRALRMGMLTRFCTNGCTVDDKRNCINTDLASGKDHISGILRILSRLELRNVKCFEFFLDDVAAGIDNSEVYIITSYVSDAICMHARKLAKAGNAVRMVILDPLLPESALPGDISTYTVPKNRYVSGADDSL